MLDCSSVIFGKGNGQDYHVKVGMVVEVEINLVELLVNGWELKFNNGKRDHGGDKLIVLYY